MCDQENRYNLRYPPVIKHGVLEKGPFISDVPIETQISSGFPSLPRLMTPDGMSSPDVNIIAHGTSGHLQSHPIFR